MKFFVSAAAVMALLVPALASPACTTATCTSTKTVAPTFNLDPTTTIYKKTATATLLNDCAGCSIAVVTRNLGPGPVHVITATVTSPVTTTTVNACSKTAGLC